MQIDWITVAAQVINFLILLWLLNRFLFKPVLGVVDARADELQARLDAAAEARRDAESEKDRLTSERGELASAAKKTLDDAEKAARQIADAARKEAQTEAERERQSLKRSFEQDRRAFADDLAKTGARTVLAIVRRIFEDLTQDDLNGVAWRRFRAAVEALPDDQKARLAEACSSAPARLAAPERPSQAHLRDLSKILGVAVDRIEPEIDPQIALGARLTAGSHVLDWTLEAYLDDLGSRFEGVLQTDDQTNRSDSAPSPQTALDGAST